MKILTLNGSPKGQMSVTVQYVRYAEQIFPEHTFRMINSAQMIRKFVKNDTYRSEVLAALEEADLILFAYPLYYATVNSQYMEFLEMLRNNSYGKVLAGTYAASLSTSIHFYDNFAQDFIRAFCDDMGMQYIDGITPIMDDLLKTEFRSHFQTIFSTWLTTVEQKQPTQRRFFPLPQHTLQQSLLTENNLLPDRKPEIAEGPEADTLPTMGTDHRITIVADCSESASSSLRRMVGTLQNLAPHAETLFLRDMQFGPCLGCLHCGFDNVCSYEGKDAYLPAYRENVLPADILIFALQVDCRYFSSVFQRYLERSFVKNHQTTLKGKQVAYVISGPLSRNHLLQEVLTGYTETMGGNLVSMISDEPPTDAFTPAARPAGRTEAETDPSLITRKLQNLLSTVITFSESGVKKPISFLGVGGMKVFRDSIYSHLRFVFQQDHSYYKRHGLYDFPQKQWKKRLIAASGSALSRLPFLRKRIQPRLKSGMVHPYRKLFR